MGVNKVLVFVKSIDLKERKAIGIRLEDDNGGNGLTEDWMKVERVCLLHNKRKTRFSSAITQPMRDDERRMRCNYKLPPKEESLKREDSTILDIEAFIKEAYESLKVQVEAKENLIMESKSIKMVIKKEENSQQRWSNDMANMKAQVRYDNTTGEGAEQASFLTYGGITVKRKVEDSRA